MASWSSNEVLALLSIWGEESVQTQLDGAVRNKEVFVKISRKQSELGFTKDWKQCHIKVKNLKTSYKTVKDNNGVTWNGRKTFKFYKQLDQILGHRPASVPSVVIDIQAEIGVEDDDVVTDKEEEEDDAILEDNDNGKSQE